MTRTVAVIGLGKLGLPLAVQFAAPDNIDVDVVVGVDIDASLVDCVNDGREPWPGEEGLANSLRDVVGTGRLRATVDAAEGVRDADVVVVVVPLLVDESRAPDFTHLDTVVMTIGSHLQSGTLVSFETTMPVGTTGGRLAPALAGASGLALEEELFVVHSPERVLTGRVFADLRRYPKLVGGVGPSSLARGIAFYEQVLDFDPRPDLVRPNGVWGVTNVATAEAVKLAETTYRNVNIGLANEFAQWADGAGVDVHEVIAGANSQPFSHIHQPGISVGGHCIPVYPHLYLHGDPAAAIPAAAVATNEAMPSYAVDLLEANLESSLDGALVAVLGLSYRPGVKEAAFSGCPVVVEELRRRGARPVVEDPLYSDAELEALGLVPLADRGEIDAVILHTEHEEWKQLGSRDFPSARVVIDGRRHLDASRWTEVRFVRLGSASSGGDAQT